MLNNELFGKELEGKINNMNLLMGEDAYYEYHPGLDRRKENREFHDLIVDDGLRTYVIELDYGVCLIHFDSVQFKILAKSFDYQNEKKQLFRFQTLSEEEPVTRGVRLIESYIDLKLWMAKQREDTDENYSVTIAGIGMGNRIAVEIKDRVSRELFDYYGDYAKRCKITVIDGLVSLQEKIFSNSVSVPPHLGNNTLFQKLCKVYAMPFPERVPFSEYGEGLQQYFEEQEEIACTIVKNHNRRVFEPWIPQLVRIKSNLFIGAIYKGKPCGILAATIEKNGIQVDYIHMKQDKNSREICVRMLKMLIQIQEDCDLGEIRILLWNDILKDKEYMEAAITFLEELGFHKDDKKPITRYEMEFQDAWESPLNQKKVESNLKYISLEDASMGLWDTLEHILEENEDYNKLDAERLSARSYNKHCTMIALDDGKICGAMLIGGFGLTYWIHRLYTFDMKPADILYMTQLVMLRIYEEIEDNQETAVKLLFETEQENRGEYMKQYAQGKASTNAISYIREKQQK